MVDYPYYSQENHGPYETHGLGRFSLEEGGDISDSHLAYATFVRLNNSKSNAILVPTWYGGTSKIMEHATIGEGRALDPKKDFIAT
jgi:homoserine O-acetyltransferase